LNSTGPFRTPETFVDVAFSRRLELNEMLGPLDYVQLQRKSHPDLGFAWQEIAGGFAFYAMENSPLNQAVGLGLHGPVTSAEFDAFEEFFRSRNSPAQLVLSPLADVSLMQLAGERGYKVTEFNSVLYNRVPRGYQATQHPELHIERVQPKDSQRWAEVLIAGFEGQGVFPTDLFAPYALMPHSISYMAWLDGIPVAGAGGAVYPDRGVAAMFGAATLPDYRGRGAQNALLQVRLQAAAEAGCELAVICTQPGSGSQRNAERQGFRVAYTKVVMVRAFN
jgi:GNAT superfamily N-acetyltransferase